MKIIGVLMTALLLFGPVTVGAEEKAVGTATQGETAAAKATRHLLEQARVNIALRDAKPSFLMAVLHRQLAGVHIAADAGVLDDIRVTINAEAETGAQILDKLTEAHGLRWSIRPDGVVRIYREGAASAPNRTAHVVLDPAKKHERQLRYYLNRAKDSASKANLPTDKKYPFLRAAHFYLAHAATEQAKAHPSYNKEPLPDLSALQQPSAEENAAFLAWRHATPQLFPNDIRRMESVERVQRIAKEEGLPPQDATTSPTMTFPPGQKSASRAEHLAGHEKRIKELIARHRAEEQESLEWQARLIRRQIELAEKAP